MNIFSGIRGLGRRALRLSFNQFFSRLVFMYSLQFLHVMTILVGVMSVIVSDDSR